jgi:hypothetical protein
MTVQTPYYLIDKTKLMRNLVRIDELRERSGAKVLLALKCFATWSVFDLMRPHMDGTTSSSLNEVRLGAEKFGGETHAYSVAFADHEIDQVMSYADKIIFNSIGGPGAWPAPQSRHQLIRLRSRRSGAPLQPARRMGSGADQNRARPHRRLHDSQ